MKQFRQIILHPTLAQKLCLCPLLFNGIQIRTVGWQPQNTMAMSVQQFLNAFIFMKPSIIHYDHAFGFKTWDQCLFAPPIEYIAVNVLLKVIQRKQHLFIKNTNDVSLLFRLPIVAIYTRAADWYIGIRSYCFSLKATLVHIYNGIVNRPDFIGE